MSSLAKTGAFMSPGQFYSSIAKRSSQSHGYLLSDLAQPHSRRLPVHTHELSYFFFVLDGHFRESDRKGTREFSPMSGGFNPSDTAHDGIVGPAGVRFFTVELLSKFVAESGVQLPHDPLVDHGSRNMVWAGLKLLLEFRSGEAADPLTCDSLICEMLADISEYHGADCDRSPSWLVRICKMLDDLRQPELRISALADEAGVHPVHLSRVFRKLRGLSPGEYRQKLRVRVACDLLLNSKQNLAEVACDAGFSDQSHLTHIFKRVLGVTPGQFRMRTKDIHAFAAH
jgi:AraC family transcriptional regulator